MDSPKPSLTITYCPACRWLLRSAWLAQELLTTFEQHLAQVALAPSPVAGTFTIMLGEDLLWDRRRDGGFPELAPLKRLVRDRVAPDMPLGHSDTKALS